MKKISKKVLSSLLVLSLACGTLAACGGKDKPQGSSTGSNASEKTSEPNSSESGKETESEAGSEAPDGEKVTLTYWTALNGNVEPNYQNLGDTPLYQEYEKRMNVNIDFQHPGSGQANEAFAVLLSSSDLPDIIEWNWLTYTGGPEKALLDEVIMDHSDIIENNAPNLKAYLEANPEIAKQVKTDDGRYYTFPFIRGDEKLLFSSGIIVRQDWLDELGLEMPKTMDQWEEVLTKFKEEKGATAPLTYVPYMLGWGHWTNPFGIQTGFYRDDEGKVKYGQAEPAYKEFLKTFHDWFQKGLIDPDIASMDEGQANAKMTSGQAGVSMGWIGGNMGAWTNAGRETNPDYTLAGAPVPVMKEGEEARFGSYDFPYTATNSASITTSCKNVEAAAKFLDYGYSEEGHDLLNFGIEGVSYDMVDGYPTYKEELYNDPSGKPLGQALASYIRANYNGPFVQDVRYIEQYYPFDEQKEAYETWSHTNAKDHKMPPITFTPEEAAEYAQLMNEIQAECDRAYLAFLFGDEDIDANFDKYVETIKDLGLDRAIEINETALARYNER